MPVEWKYRGRVITAEDIAFLRQFLVDHSGMSRRKLSAKVCEAWQWKQANGALCDMVCRGLLLMLHRAGEIQLPEVRFVPRNPFVKRERPQPMLIDTTPVIAPLKELRPVEVQQVRRTGDEPLFNSLIEHHHYLGYEQPVGEHLKYLVWAQGRPIACLAWSSAPRHLGSRDRYIGWSTEARKRNIRLIAYNTRFLILPWIQVPHLASHILSRVAATLSHDWERMYRAPDLVRGDFHRSGALSRNVLPCRELGPAGTNHRPRQGRSYPSPEPLDQGSLRTASETKVPRATEPVSR